VDQMYLLLLAIAVIVAFAALVVMRARLRTPTTPEGNDSPFGVSTEGMKMCQKCGMGNLWTERRCSACGSPLRG
jgi:uncharacterized paraquat-inducible protein A